MAVYVDDRIRNKGLEALTTITSGKIVLCAGAPASFAEANATYDGTAGKKKTGEVSITGSEITLQAGAPNGRQALFPAKSISVSYTGGPVNSDHVAILDVTNSVLMAYVDFTPREFLTGDTADVSSWHVRLAQAVKE